MPADLDVPGAPSSLASMFRSWRLASVALLSFSSGLPLGLVWIAIPTWMAQAGVDIKVVGLFTLAQAPWSFKFLWSPLMDRYPLPFLGRRRGWVFASQIGLLLLGLWLSLVSGKPEAVLVIGTLALAIGLVAATHDIAYDAYAVEVLRPEEHGLAVGARTSLYRLAMFFSGGLSITLASTFTVQLFGRSFTWYGSWAWVNLMLALLYVPCLWVTLRAPEPEVPMAPPRTLREAVFGPFLGLLAQHRALEILAFVVLFKLSDNLTQALLRPFFVKVGFADTDVGVATMTIGTAGLLVGTFLGGLLTQTSGLGRALWITGILQIGSNLGYAVVAEVGPNRPVMYAAQAFEYLTSGLGTGAFGVELALEAESVRRSVAGPSGKPASRQVPTRCFKGEELDDALYCFLEDVTETVPDCEAWVAVLLGDVSRRDHILDVLSDPGAFIDRHING
jgi:PAT family beta-lactamase induction signal transducer AmpG